MTWAEYVKALVESDNQSEIARRTGVSTSTAHRWLKGSLPDTATVWHIVRRFDLDPVEAFIAASGVSDDEKDEMTEWARSRPDTPSEPGQAGTGA